MPTKHNLWRYVLRFTVVHVFIYMVTGAIFLTVQDALPGPTQVALETFTPYQPLGIIVIMGQVLRSVILALILYPFYDTIIRGRYGLPALFGALWGVAWLGSVGPMPGSIEGVIYTEIPLVAHLLVLAVVALETFVFAWLFVRWERRGNAETSQRETGGEQHG